jgi:tyrosyl-tRNA synthetase
MTKNFVDELKWRGMIHDMMPETDKVLSEGTTAGYIGFDPTADSLHIGSLVQIMILMHFQRAGHKPIALVGGATGMIGDPSGKSAERNLLDGETLDKNVAALKNQLGKFLDFDSNNENAAVLVNNYDWMSRFSLIDFARDIGKHLTVNYMMAKDSVKKRLGAESKEGMSFTEFTYQLIQGYDFLHLYQHHNCVLQMGGSDQWGNITTGTELIRRKLSGKAYAITCPLITKADGTKFGKSEGGNVWLDKQKTSPYSFYQYWLNTSDEDAVRYIKIFTFLNQQQIQEIINAHNEAPHQRLLQRTLADEVTRMVHSEDDRARAVQAAQILFGNATSDQLKDLDEQTLLDVFAGVPQATLDRSDLDQGIGVISLLAGATGFLASNGAARRALQERSVSVNKEKVDDTFVASADNLICNKYLLLQRGKKNYFLVIFN